MNGTAPSAPGSQPFLNYLNFERGVQVKYPANWQKVEQGDQAGFYVAFVSPQESPADQFRENLNILVEPLPGPVTLESYVQWALAQMQSSPMKLVESGPYMLGAMPAYRIVYIGPLNLLAGKWLVIWTVKNNQVYSITYTAEAARYDAFLATIQEMIDSVHIA
jgi:serine/threonine-protein kinase